MVIISFINEYCMKWNTNLELKILIVEKSIIGITVQLTVLWNTVLVWIGNNICGIGDILSHVMKIDITTSINKIVDPTNDFTFKL